MRKNKQEFVLPDGSIAIIPKEWFARFSKVLNFSEETAEGLRIKKIHLSLLEDMQPYMEEELPSSDWVDTIVNQGYVINRLKQPTHPNQEIDRPQIPFFHGNVSALWSAFLTRSELQNLNAIVKNVGRFEAKEFFS